jgi:hypothetical protein
METASFLTEKARYCRRVAEACIDDQASTVLFAMAEEFEARAAEWAASDAGVKAE